jgi:hypothetical protein
MKVDSPPTAWALRHSKTIPPCAQNWDQFLIERLNQAAQSLRHGFGERLILSSAALC